MLWKETRTRRIGERAASMNYVCVTCVRARFFVLEQGQLFEQDLYFFYLFIIIIFFYFLLFFFFGNNHGRACVIIICVRPASRSHVGQWSGVQQVNKLDARARCSRAERWSTATENSILFYRIIIIIINIYVTCVCPTIRVDFGKGQGNG